MLEDEEAISEYMLELVHDVRGAKSLKYCAQQYSGG